MFIRSIKKIAALIIISFLGYSCVWAKQSQDLSVFEIAENDSEDNLIAYISVNPDSVSLKAPDTRETVLFTAVRKNYSVKTIDFIIKKGGSINDKTAKKQTILMYACKYHSDLTVIDRFINVYAPLKTTKKARILKKDGAGNDSFYYASLNKNAKEVFALLLQYVPDYDTTVFSIEEIEQGSISEVDEQKDENTDIMTEDDLFHEDKSPDPEKLSLKLNEIVAENERMPEKEENTKKTLYDYFPSSEDFFIPSAVPHSSEKRSFIKDCNAKDEKGVTLLMEGCKKGNLTLIKDLIYSKANLDETDNEGWTALMYACRYQSDSNVVKTLIDEGCDVYKKNIYGLTALNIASSHAKNPRIIQVLLKNRTPSEEDVRLSFVTAIKAETTLEILEVFFEKGVAVNTPYKGMSPLMYACQENSETIIISWLIEHGANINYKTNSGKTAFDFAMQNKKIQKDNIYWSLNTAYQSGAY